MSLSCSDRAGLETIVSCEAWADRIIYVMSLDSRLGDRGCSSEEPVIAEKTVVDEESAVAGRIVVDERTIVVEIVFGSRSCWNPTRF